MHPIIDIQTVERDGRRRTDDEALLDQSAKRTASIVIR